MAQAEFNRQTSISAVSNLSIGVATVNSTIPLGGATFEVLYIFAPANSICTVLMVQAVFDAIPGGVSTKSMLFGIGGIGAATLSANCTDRLEIVYGEVRGATTFSPNSDSAMNDVLRSFMFDADVAMEISFIHASNASTTAQRFCGVKYKKEMISS